MSQRWGQIEEFDLGETLGNYRDWYHIPTLVVLMAFMLWVRVRGWGNFFQNGRVVLSGNDAWYHLRQTTYTVKHWPQTMPFDPWTYFSYGTSNSQFGTLFDQLMATVALIVGLGDPSQQTISLVVLAAPAVVGTLVAIPVYIAGRRMGGRFGGLVSVLVLALSTGGFLRRSLVGFSDHHVAEALFQMLAVVGIMVAVSVAEKERPVWELLVNREWEALRRPIGWAMLAGVAIGTYLWVWPPGVLLLGILGLFFLLQLTADFLRGRSPDHIAFTGVFALGVTGLLALVPFNSFEFTATNFSLLQPAMAFTIAFGCAFMAWLARQFEGQDIDYRLYPLAVFGLLAAATLVVRFGAPDLYAFLAQNIERVVGLGQTARGSTVGEVQPLRRPVVTLFAHFGLTYLSAAVAVLALLFTQLRSKNAKAESLFLVIWTVILLLATLTQSRFDYYLAMPIAVLNAYIIMRVARYIKGGKDQEIEAFQVITVAAVLFLIVAPMAIFSGAGAQAAWTAGENNAPSGGVVGWGGSLEWLSDNTPEPGTYGGANNTMQFYGTYPKQADYDYPEGAYGVMSWWDYGHWITERGERIPTANPFQQGATEAANFLLAPNESHANDVLDRVDEDDAQTRYVMVDWKMVNTRSQYGGKFFAPTVFYTDSNESLRDFRRSVVAGTSSAQIRTAYHVRTQRYYESMVNRLWHFHGSAQQPNAVTVNYTSVPTQQGTLYTVPQSNGTRFDVLRLPQPPWYQALDRANMSTADLRAAERQARRDAEQRAVNQTRQSISNETAQIGGIGPNPRETVDALEHYRLVRNSEFNATDANRRWISAFVSDRNGLLGNLDVRNLSDRQAAQLSGNLETVFFPDGRTTPPWVKIFERVPGGTIEGTGPANTTVTADVRIRSPARNNTFTYTQYADTGTDGQFEMTVPYSTTGYENFGPESGYTNVSARAVTDYNIYSDAVVNGTEVIEYNANATVTEAQVNGVDTAPTEVTLERDVIGELRTQAPPENGTSDGNSTDDSSTSGNSTDGNTTDGSSTDGSDSGTSTNSTESTNTTDGSTNESTNMVDPARTVRP